jgi:SAM-dependent methyltransferase
MAAFLKGYKSEIVFNNARCSIEIYRNGEPLQLNFSQKINRCCCDHRKGRVFIVQKEYYFDSNIQSDAWDTMWTIRTIENELEACDLETPARDLFMSYIPKGGRVIDGGCGFGKWVIYLKKLGYDIVGIDNNKLAITKMKDYDESLQVELGDILDIRYPDNTFDAYISMGVVEHFEDGPLPAFKEAYRVLKPNGLIFVSVPTSNVIRNLIRRPLRKVFSAVPVSFGVLRSGWSKSKRGALLAAAGAMMAILPERIIRVLVRGRRRYYHFIEYRYSRSELESFLKQSGFEVMKTVAHDYYGSKDYAVGLVVDFPFLAARNGVNFQLNVFGKLISRTLNRVSPWIACSSVICLGRARKLE